MSGTGLSSIRSGLVSATFRQLKARRIVELVREARLDLIEWGADVHVPPNALGTARDVRKMTEDVGVSIAAYGSYYRAGVDEASAFDDVLASAVNLGAPVIRVWAGATSSVDSSERQREKITNDLRRICALAANSKISVALEYHRNTLTDDLASATKLLKSLAEVKLKTLWQPSTMLGRDQHRREIKALLPYLEHCHCFHWHDYNHRFALADGADDWKVYIDKLGHLGRPTSLLLEFVRDDSPEQFLADAATLRTWLGANNTVQKRSEQ